MVAGRNEYGEGLVIGFGSTLERAYTDVWDIETERFVKRGYWVSLSRYDPIMTIPNYKESPNNDEVDTEIAKFQKKFADLKWEDGLVNIEINRL